MRSHERVRAEVLTRRASFVLVVVVVVVLVLLPLRRGNQLSKNKST